MIFCSSAVIDIVDVKYVLFVIFCQTKLIWLLLCFNKWNMHWVISSWSKQVKCIHWISELCKNIHTHKNKSHPHTRLATANIHTKTKWDTHAHPLGLRLTLCMNPRWLLNMRAVYIERSLGAGSQCPLSPQRARLVELSFLTLTGVWMQESWPLPGIWTGVPVWRASPQ